MDEHAPNPRAAPQDWIDALDRAQADLAAGRTEPWTAVRARMTAAIEAMEAKQAKRQA